MRFQCSKCGIYGVFSVGTFTDVEGRSWLVRTNGIPIMHIDCIVAIDEDGRQFKIDPDTKERVYL